MATTVAAATPNSVPLPEIPVKLRCNICSGLARGAVRLPCCEQAICEICHSNLPNVCGVCDHSPLNADDCKPNSALRTTVAVFLRTAEKKHALALQKEQKSTQQQHQQQPQHHQQKQHIQVPQQYQQYQQQKPQQQQAAGAVAVPEAKAPESQPAEHNSTTGDDQPVTPAAKTNMSAAPEGKAGLPEEKKQEQSEVVQRDAEVTAKGKIEKHDSNAGLHDAPSQISYNEQSGAWFGGNAQNPMAGMAQSMYPGQDMSGAAGWGVYGVQSSWDNGYGGNMMGYSMMNPMVMAQGYGGGNFGMGVGGYGGANGGGMDWGNGWNGQNNMGYNQGMTGMRNGGYYSAASAAGGYNHQSQGSHQVPSQQYQNPHFQRQQNFPRSGGFAGGAGNRPYHASDSAQQQQQQLQQNQQQGYGEGAFQQQIQGIAEVTGSVKKAPSSTGGETKGEKIPSIISGDSDDIDAADAAATTAPTTTPTNAVVPTETESTVVAGSGEHVAAAPVATNSAGNTNIPTAPMSQPDVAVHPIPLHDDYSGQAFQNFQSQPYNNAYPARGGFGRGNFGGVGRGGFRVNGHLGGPGVRGGFGMDGGMVNGMPTANDKTVPPGFGKGVEGAPTGPKAMREGKPNRGIMPRGGGFVGRGGYNGGGGSSWSRSHSPNDRITDRARSYSRSVSNDSRRRSRSRDGSHDRDRPRRRSRSPSRRHRSRSRKRSPTPSKDSDSERGRTPTRLDSPSKPASPAKTPLASVPEDQPPSTSRGKRSREASGTREHDDVASRTPSRSRSRSGERRHKRSRRHRRRSTSPDREKEKDRSSRHHRKHRSHRSRKHRRSRSRSRSRSPQRDVSDTEAGERSSQRSSRERRRKHRSRKEEESRDRARGERERDRDRHRSHRHRSSRHERHERQREHGRDDGDGNNVDKPTTERKPSATIEPLSPSKSKKPGPILAGGAGKPERKLSYKYEDEGDLERRAERDREAERWGVK